MKKILLLIIFLAFLVVAMNFDRRGQLGKILLSQGYHVSKIWFGFETEPFEVKGSKYIIADRLKGDYIESVPRALSYMGEEEDKANQTKSFGVSASWSRKGYNWVDVIPAANNPQYLKPFPGRIKSIDMWVWGANYNYELYLSLENSDKYAYNLRMGDLRFVGWKSLSLQVPATIMSYGNQRYIPRKDGLTLKRIRIYTQPTERVDRFNVFFDNMRIITDTFGGEFDGIEIERLLEQRGKTSAKPADNNNAQ